jgi:glycolate oxidase FAD binding subunit
LPSVSEVSSLGEAAELLRHASAERTTVSIEHEGGDVVLSTARLDRVLEHESGDLTCIVEAGIRVGALNRYLEPAGQWFPLDPGADPTVGACLARNLSGPRRHRYGTMRDLVLGITVVLGDGVVASSGGKVVKNVAGYDLGKLFCGSEGRLGLIGRVALRLHPRPQAARHLVVRSGSLETAYEQAQTILRSQLAPNAVELSWPESQLAVLFEGTEKAVAAQISAARSLVGGAEDDGSAWASLDGKRLSAAGKLSVGGSALVEVLPAFEWAVASVAAGVAYVSEPVPDSRDPVEIALAERVRAEFDPQGVLV